MMMVGSKDEISPNVVTEDDLDQDFTSGQTPDATSEKTPNSDWDSRLELLRVCSSNGKFVTKKARAPPIGGKWATDEDELLRDIVKAHGAENWRKVASLLGPTRTDVQCLHRWNKVLRPGLQKGAWSLEEDKLVREAVRYQANNGVGRILWSEIATQLPGRLGKQCRERYFNHLDPSINKGDWTPPEDRILFEGQKQFGNRWCEISKVLPGRTENSVKNRWNSSAMRRWLKENNLSAGDGTPLHDIAAIEDLQRALAAFSDALAACGIAISKETAATLLSDMTNIAVTEKKSIAKDKVKKEKVSKKNPAGIAAAASAEMETEFIFDDFTEGISRSSSMADNAGSHDGGEFSSKEIEMDDTPMGNHPHTLSRSSSGSQSVKSRSSSTTGMALPSHLRPPLIVTADMNSEGSRLVNNSSSLTMGMATGTSEDHLLLVELLSNMKSSPKWGQQEPTPPSSSSSADHDRKRSQFSPYDTSVKFNTVGDSAMGNPSSAYGSSKRVMVGETPMKKQSGDVVTPTDRALKRVRAELARREASKVASKGRGGDSMYGSGSGAGSGAGSHTADGHPMSSSVNQEGSEIVPFQLLLFFKCLDDFAQRCLIQQLVQHFQRTNYTPRNLNALLPTPRINYMGNPLGAQLGPQCIPSTGAYSYGYDHQTSTLTLCSPRGERLDRVSAVTCTFDPKCFEEEYSSVEDGAKIFYSSSLRMRDGGGDEEAFDYFDAVVDAAAHVALKCATREASFEDVLSWLGRAPESCHFAPRYDMSETETETEASGAGLTSRLNGDYSEVSSNGGMALPSHLRPPLIVTDAAHDTNSRVSMSLGPNHPTTATEDHLLLVELLSNMKSSPKWGQQEPTPPPPSSSSSADHDRKRSQFSQYETSVKFADGTARGGGTNKRVKVEGSMKKQSGDVVTPTDRALKRVRAELARREVSKVASKGRGGDSMYGSGSGAGSGAGSHTTDGHPMSSSVNQEGSEIVPFQLLPFFKYLGHHSQRCLMRQLVDHFQQTSYTPRNLNALLPTPRFSYSSAHLSAGGGCISDDIDPNCFEEGAVTFTSRYSFSSQQTKVSTDIAVQGDFPYFKGAARLEAERGHSTQEEMLARGEQHRSLDQNEWDRDIDDDDSCSSGAVQAYLDAPVNAAVNVALKCATREASFEEVLSWLIGASSHQSGYEYAPPPFVEAFSSWQSQFSTTNNTNCNTQTHTPSHLSTVYYQNHSGTTLSPAYEGMHLTLPSHGPTSHQVVPS